MNYKKLYKQFINSRKLRTELSGYSESHHIVPRCLSGSDDKKNLVNLTAREHYFAHALLSRIYNNAQMANAWHITTRKYKHYRVLSDYKIKKASDSRIGKTLSPETCAKMSASRIGKTSSPEHRAKMSAWQLGKKRGPLSSETRAKLSAAQTGKKFSPEHRAKLSAAKTGNKLSPEHRAKISAARIGMKFSPETRAKISAAKQGWALKKKLATL
jgi:hypothetical protein